MKPSEPEWTLVNPSQHEWILVNPSEPEWTQANLVTQINKIITVGATADGVTAVRITHVYLFYYAIIAQQTNSNRLHNSFKGIFPT